MSIKMIGVKDLMKDLKTKNPRESSSGADITEEIEDDDEFEVIQRPHYTSVKNVLNKYSNLNNLLKDMEDHLSQMKSMVTADHANQFNQKDFDKKRRDNQQISNTIVKIVFKKLESTLPEADDFTTLSRMKRLLYHGFFHRYVELWTKNEDFFKQYEESMKKKLKLQSQIINSNLTDEDIETMMENKNTSLFMSNILQDTEASRIVLDEIKGRFEELKKLEKSIAEVHNLFISLQTLVAEQGEILQRIETHFDATQNYIEEAAKTLDQAMKLKRKRCCMPCRCIASLCCFNLCC